MLIEDLTLSKLQKSANDNAYSKPAYCLRIVNGRELSSWKEQCKNISMIRGRSCSKWHTHSLALEEQKNFPGICHVI